MDGTFPLEEPETTSPGAHARPHVLSRDHYSPYDAVPAFDVRGLMGTSTTAHLVLDEQTYCLRITRSGKLILTK